MRNVVLCGFMGCGKTTVGRQLAALSGRRFVDMDEYIEQQAGMAVSEIFRQYGEDDFRRRERETCRALAGQTGLVIAAGGGALTFAANVEALRPSCVIVLLLAFLYYKFKGFSVIQGILAGVRPAVVAMIASAGVSMVLLAVYGTRTLPADPTAVQWTAVAILAGGLVVLRKWKVNPVWVILGSGLVGILAGIL